MNGIDVLRQAYAATEGWLRLIEETRANPLVRPGEFGGNHPLWVIGHLAVIEGRVHKAFFGTPNPLEHWKPLFDAGSEPHDDATKYPSFDEVLKAFRELRSKTLAYLDTLDEAALDKPIDRPPPGLEKPFATVGRGLLTIALHQTFHLGEAAVARRASGLKPRFQPTQAFRDF
jgi:hypothetical protein